MSVDVEVNVKDLDDSEESVVAFVVKEVNVADSDLDNADDAAAVVDDDDDNCWSLMLLVFLSNIEYSSAEIFLRLLLTVSCIKLELMLPVMFVMDALEVESSCSCLAEEVRT